MKICDVGSALLNWPHGEATQAMLACGFSPDSLQDMEVLGAYDAGSGIIEVAIFSSVGIYIGNNADGWNAINSVREFYAEDASEIDAEFGEGASERPIWRAFLAKIHALNGVSA